MSEPDLAIPTIQETLGDIPGGLQALFDRDPLSLTRIEKNLILEELRKQRVAFSEAESEAKTAGKRVNAKKAVKSASGSGGGKTLSSDALKSLMNDL